MDSRSGLFTEEEQSLIVSIIFVYHMHGSISHSLDQHLHLFYCIQRIYSQEWPITPPETPSAFGGDVATYTRPDNVASANQDLNFTPTKVYLYMYTTMCIYICCVFLTGTCLFWG